MGRGAEPPKNDERHLKSYFLGHAKGVPPSYVIWMVAKQLGMWPGYLEWLIDEGGGSDWWLKILKILELEAIGADAQQHRADRVYVTKS